MLPIKNLKGFLKPLLGLDRFSGAHASCLPRIRVVAAPLQSPLVAFLLHLLPYTISTSPQGAAPAAAYYQPDSQKQVQQKELAAKPATATGAGAGRRQ
jgi:hypothetical protein